MKHKILIVDDTSMVRRYIHDLLSEQGYDVIGEAQNGKEAVVLVETTKPDLVTLDLMMPDSDSMSIQEIVAAMRRFKPDIKILVVSAIASDTQRFLTHDKLEVDGFINKPFETNDFIRKVQKLIGS